MIEFSLVSDVLRGIGILYWALAIGLLALALWKGKDWKDKLFWAVPVVCFFGYLPVTKYIAQQKHAAYSKEAWAYFKNLCDTKSGEKIYKTFAGVKSVQIVNPLPPAQPTDLYDQFWYGDPYSSRFAGEDRTIWAARQLLSNWPKNGRGLPDVGLDEIEVPVLKNGQTQYQRMTWSSAPPYYQHLEPIGASQSRFELSWNDISTADDRKYWVAASHLKVIDRTDKSVVAERIGYLIEPGFGSTGGARRPWLNAWDHQGASCPQLHQNTDRWFVLKVLNPVAEKQNGK